MALPFLVIVYLLTQPHSLTLPANPDGRVYLEKGGEHTLWKKNRNNVDNCNNWQYGVDPNRNFPFKWGECDDSMQTCSTSSQCESVVYRGHGPKSEVETKAILEYAASIFPTGQRKGSVQFSVANYNTPFSKYSQGVFIDVHSHGQYVGWPWGFANQRTPNDEGLGALGRKLASFNGYRLWAPTMPNRQCELLFWPANNVHLASIICSQYLINCWTLLFVQMDSMAEP